MMVVARCLLVFVVALAAVENFVAARVCLGIDALVANDFSPIRGKRVGLITHAAAVDHRGVPTAEHFRTTRSVNLVAFFGPEHGIDGTAPAGQYVPTRTDPRSGLPVYSLYGPTRKPTREMLRNVDVLVFDMQDIGARSYTYISTMGLAMQAAAENGVEFMVLDRPNPLGGQRVEGPALDPAYRSFVGQFEVPYVHGLTVGELAFFLNETSWMARHPLRLHVVKMQGWRRSMLWQDTGLRWVPTSPNIPEARSAFDYVATGWLGELGTVNNGIFTDYPFRVVGLRNLDAESFVRFLRNKHDLPGLQLTPLSYSVTRGRFAGESYSGAKLDYSDVSRARLTEFSPLVLAALRELTGRDYVSSAPVAKLEMFDKVTGGSTLRRVLVNSPQNLKRLFAQWEREADKFRAERKRFLLYSD
jgi:uncharacterized protein YbbC (DUF1343 family)